VHESETDAVAADYCGYTSADTKGSNGDADAVSFGDSHVAERLLHGSLPHRETRREVLPSRFLGDAGGYLQQS
jgi:hypothetical protein